MAGLVWTLLLNGGLGLAAWTAARDLFDQTRPPSRGPAAVVLGWAWLTIGMELLGILGFLTRIPLLGWVGAGLMVALVGRLLRRRRGVCDGPAESDDGRAWGWEGVLAVGLLLWAAVPLVAASLFGPVKVVSDGPIYHLYFAVQWWKAGRLELVPTPFGETAAPYFPAVGDLWFTWLTVGWGGTSLAKVGQAPFLLIAGCAAHAMARRLGGGQTSSVVAAAWACSSTPLLIFTAEANVDTIFLAGYLLSTYFFLRHALGDDGTPALWLGALAAGCTLGTKPTGIVFVPPLLLVGLILALRRAGGWRGRVQVVLVVSGGVLATAGFWYARDAWLTGNPLYPLHLEAFGHVWLRGWFAPRVMRLSPYYLPPGDLRSLIDILLTVLDPRLVPVWLAAIAGLWAWRRPTSGRVDGWVWVVSGLAVLNVLLYWLAVPYRTQPRFMLQAAGLAAVPLARLFDRSTTLRTSAVLLLGLHVLTPQAWPFAGPGENPPWDLSPFIPNALPALVDLPLGAGRLRALANSGQTWPTVGRLLTGLIVFVAAWVWGGRRNPKQPRALRPCLATVAGALTVGSLLYPWSAPPRSLFYPYFPDYLRGWLELEQRSGPAGVRVAYAGTNLPFYLMAVGLRNDVRYVNVDAHPGYLLHDYHREAVGGSGPATWPDTRPLWDRLHPDYDAWLANLRASGAQLLVVARANPAEGPLNVADAEGFTIEKVWADSHPDDFEPIYGRSPRDPQFRLYRVREAR